MKKFSLILIITIVMLSQSNLSSFAKDGNEIKTRSEVKNNTNLEQKRIEFNSNTEFINKIKEEFKNRFQFREKENKNEFFIKGVIASYSANLIEINGKQINIDPSVTGEIKIIGNPIVGSYAIVKGITLESNLYATKIVINQRNKHDIDDEDEDENENGYITPTPTISPAITLTPTPTPIGSQSAEVNTDMDLSKDLGNLIISVQEFLNYLKELASKI